ncbi:helix-turn-helix domain-containing protein [Stenotrophomonas sp. GD03680]|uniref:LexA family transcriptional regulator n=1 Tax=Stenotrophomonas sp. GD03680 TaxID=2975365 RepID=UPI00244D3C3F|nr:helix-turn-helix domain-containing protein [Stenotrophomonas sp. GD03680]MDH2022924.1 helix-turn-helix domain-containing protein [Stenotrophomonas sp. GD03680]
MNTRKAKPSAQDLTAAAKLKAIWSERARRRGLTQDKLAQELGITQGAISQYLNGRIPMNYRTLRAFTDALGIVETDIRSDLPEQQLNAPSAPAEEYLEVLALPQSAGLTDGSEAEEYAQANAMKFRKSVLRRKGLLTRPLAVFYARGRSMEPVIADGDSVLLDLSEAEVVHGNLYLVQLCCADKVEYCVRRALVLDDTVFFSSESVEHGHAWRKPRKADSEDEPIRVIGKACWIGGWSD